LTFFKFILLFSIEALLSYETTKKTELLEIIEKMIEAIQTDNTSEKNRILDENPWTRRWINNRSHCLDLKEIADGNDYRIELERPLSGVRKDHGLKPLLYIKVSSSEGERFFRFEPSVKNEEEFRSL